MITNTGDIYSKNIINDNNITINDKIRINGQNGTYGKIERFILNGWRDGEAGLPYIYTNLPNPDDIQQGGEIFNNYDSNTAKGLYSHAEGSLTHADNICTHAEGSGTTASGNYSHAEGFNTTASGEGAHAEGKKTQNNFTLTNYPFLNNNVGVIPTSIDGTNINGISFSNNTYTIIPGSYNLGSHIENLDNYANGCVKWNNNNITLSSSYGGHSEGNLCVSIGGGSHSEGYGCVASGEFSHAEGLFTHALQNNSHASGERTLANTQNGTVVGQYNTGASNQLFTVGAGTQSSHNDAFFVDTSGNTTINGNLILGNFTISISGNTLTIQ